jgi:GTP diphosphokinase / guanosine-3',5'-bis(diphosphate) 3'-diphosphatase
VWVEVQIRSKRMDKIAEYGPAAHWSYKDGQQKTSLEKWLGEIRDVLENDRLALGDILESMKPEDISEEIYVFTAKKDSKKEIRRFSKGATILDFAYSIHSEIGNRCVGATVNNISVEKGYVLKNGDAINVQTSKSQKPSLDWLKIATTAKAKYHIRKSLNEEHELLVSNGKEILKRKFKNWKYNFTDSVNDVVQYFGYKFGNDMFYDVATEKLPTIKIKSFLDNKNEYLEGKNTVEIISKTKPKTGNIYLAMTEDDKKINGIYCNCCEVHPGDSVFGFISNTAEIKIHRTNCPNANYLKSRFPYRIIELKWIKT